jgi:hypothetical protein
VISERHKMELVRAYREGRSGRRYVRMRREPGPITVRPQDRDRPDERAFREGRETLGEGLYRLDRLPTADEQANGIDPRDEE